jgi:hypothetical protein
MGMPPGCLFGHSLSLGKETTADEIAETIAALGRILDRQRAPAASAEPALA